MSFARIVIIVAIILNNLIFVNDIENLRIVHGILDFVQRWSIVSNVEVLELQHGPEPVVEEL